MSIPQVAIIRLTPSQINGLETTITNFTIEILPSPPFVWTAAATFLGNAVRLVIDAAGANTNAFDDPEPDPNNGNEEKLLPVLQPISGMISQFSLPSLFAETAR